MKQCDDNFGPGLGRAVCQMLCNLGYSACWAKAWDLYATAVIGCEVTYAYMA